MMLDLKTLLADANEFMVVFREPITESAPHIYLSALPFVPPGSPITQMFRPLYPNTLIVGGEAGANLNTPFSSLMSIQAMSILSHSHQMASASSPGLMTGRFRCGTQTQARWCPRRSQDTQNM